jgi:superfamily II DNA or RNA helicase/HKD family nuclease
MTLAEGLYDLLVTEADAADLASLPGELAPVSESLDVADAADRISDALHRVLSKLLDDIDGDESERTLAQVAVVNSILADLRKRFPAANAEISNLLSPPSILRGVFRGGQEIAPPETGLAVPWLFTAGRGSPSLLSELRREIASCDAVDILVSFITLSGIRKIEDLLKSVTACGANGQPRTHIRVLTTTYTGATDIEALDILASLPGCEVRVSLDGRRTRLHAKAWIFRRCTGFGSAYVGSANLSGAALLGGLEWTVKFTQQGQENLFTRSVAHFETLWNDGEFQHYDPRVREHRVQLIQALKRESGAGLIASPTFFDIEPKDYQREMLEALGNERAHGRSKSLVVAATGTGKTVVAAFDYRRICSEQGGRPRLLFVAHRQEILTQAMRTYREVLRDHSFGELLVGGSEPEQMDHVFATIDSITSRDVLLRWGADYWHTVVIDECHRLAADRFDAFARAVKPRYMLGLTATPERADGQPILQYFDSRPDGAPAVELRLWHALDLQLLAPFEYYGCDDDTDFSDVPWSQLGELSVLDQAVTNNRVRARLVINEWTRLTGTPRNTKALAFCVSVAHAEFMAKCFNEAGLPALCLTGQTDLEVRRRAPELLKEGKYCVLVTCDLYNEGVDLPWVDTLLLLRPTQSPVLFQQQIGRGLRLVEGKESCLVLDFVGRYRTEFRFDRLLGAITGLPRQELKQAVETGFSVLPPGCHIHLQARTRAQVLDSLRAAINQTWRRLLRELQAYAALKGRTNFGLADFVRDQAIEIDDVYRSTAPSGWTALKRGAGLLASRADAEDDYFGRRFGDLLHIDDPRQLEFITQLPLLASMSERQWLDKEQQLRLLMLAYQIDGQSSQVGTAIQFLDRLSSAPELLSELRELGSILSAKSSILHRPVPGLEATPLCLHASAGIREILTAVGYYTETKRVPFQSGVLGLAHLKTELLFVTLDKSDWFHGSTAYHDYAISTELFHWQSQNSAGPHTASGKRYLESKTNSWQFQMFVRARKGDAYKACGPVELVSSEGSQPMSITWRFRHPLPLRLFQAFSVLRG